LREEKHDENCKKNNKIIKKEEKKCDVPYSYWHNNNSLHFHSHGWHRSTRKSSFNIEDLATKDHR